MLAAKTFETQVVVFYKLLLFSKREIIYLPTIGGIVIIHFTEDALHLDYSVPAIVRHTLLSGISSFVISILFLWFGVHLRLQVMEQWIAGYVSLF